MEETPWGLCPRELYNILFGVTVIEAPSDVASPDDDLTMRLAEKVVAATEGREALAAIFPDIDDAVWECALEARPMALKVLGREE